MTSKNEPTILKFLHSISQPPTSYPVLKPHNKDGIFTSKQHGIGKPNHQFPYSDNPPVIEVSPEYGHRRRRFKSLLAAGNTAMVRWCAVCCPYLRGQKIKWASCPYLRPSYVSILRWSETAPIIIPAKYWLKSSKYCLHDHILS